MVHDPVCLMELDPLAARAVVEHKGCSDYFCSEKCKTTFLAQPHGFINKATVKRLTVGSAESEQGQSMAESVYAYDEGKLIGVLK